MGLSNIILCITCFLISSILCYTYVHKKDLKKDTFAKIFVCFINELEIFCINDMIGSLESVIPGFPSIITLISFTLFYILAILMSLTMMLCVLYYFDKDLKKHKNKIILISVIFAIEILLIIINLFCPFMFDVGDNGDFLNYEYGYLFISPIYIIIFCLNLYTIIRVTKEKNKFIKKRHFGVILFVIIPSIYGLIQFLLPNASLDVVGYTLAVLIVYIYSISVKYEDELIVQSNIQKDTIVNCVSVLYNYATTDIAIEKILNLLSKYHEAENSYIFEIDFNKRLVHNIYKAKKTDNSIAQFMNMPLEVFDRWINIFEKTNTLNLKSIKKDMDQDSELYKILSSNNIESFMAVPLHEKEQITGFLAITNAKTNREDFTILHAVSSIIYTELLRRKHNKQEDEVVKILSSQYSSVLYANLSDGKIIPYALSSEVDSKYISLFESGITLERAFRIYVEQEVFYEDQERLYKYADRGFIKKCLEHQKSSQIIFKKNVNGIPIYHEVKFVKIDDVDAPPTAIAICFANKMEDVITQLVMNKLMESYASLFYINLKANTIRAIKQSETMEVGRFAQVLPYDKVVQSFANDVSEKDKKMWLKLSDPVEAQKFLTSENQREILYEVPDLTVTTRRASWTVIDRENGIPVTVIIGFMGLDKNSSDERLLYEKISAQKQDLEDQAKLLEKALADAQIANSAKTQFLSNMSHDIRTPMNAIIGFTELALQNIDNKEKIKEYMLKSNVSSQHLLSLINDILDMNRIESKKFQLNENYYSAQEVVDEIKTIIYGMAENKKQKLNLVKKEFINKSVLLDKLRVNQVVINLISNAVKFTPEGGEISVSIVQKDSVDGFGNFELKIKDNGIGMSPEFLDKIFIPFEREINTNNQGVIGTGLGMAITKNIVDMMGGDIKVESKLGKGTEFTINVKLRVSDTVKTFEKPTFVIDENKFTGKRVLVVEDNEMNREILQEILVESGFIVESAEDGKYAVDMVAQSKPGYYDIIIMDVQMPLMNGYEATKEIRKLKNKKLANIPIIAATANAFDDDKKEAIEAGMNEHVSKPISIEKLLKVIDKYL